MCNLVSGGGVGLCGGERERGWASGEGWKNKNAKDTAKWPKIITRQFVLFSCQVAKNRCKFG